MKTSQPPILATKLLGEARLRVRTAMLLLGDLIEQYRAGRSPAWFLRQALLGIVVCFAKDRTFRRICSPWIVARVSAHDRQCWPSSFESRKRTVIHGPCVIVGLRCLFDMGVAPATSGGEGGTRCGSTNRVLFWAWFSSQAMRSSGSRWTETERRSLCEAPARRC